MRRLILLIIVIMTVAMIPALCVVSPTTEDCDFLSQQIPFILETKRMLASGAPWWSWNTHFGDNFIGSYSFYTLTSPFVWLCCLFPVGKIAIGIVLSFYLKSICTGAFAYMYLRKMQFDNNLSTVGALLYTFSSFWICNLYYFHFCEPMMLFPVLLLAIERLIANGRRCYFWLSLASFAVVFINYYFALSSLVCGFAYLIVRLYATGQKGKWLIASRAVGTVLIGILCASLMLVPVICQSIGGTRSGLSGLYWHHFTPVDVVLRTLFVANMSESEQYVLINHTFCSNAGFVNIFGILLAVLYVIKRPKNWLSILLICSLVALITPANAFFSWFKSPGYTRWLYCPVLMVIVASLQYIKSGYRPSRKAIVTYAVVTAAVCLCLLLKFYRLQIFENITKRELTDIGFTFLNIAVLAYLAKSGFKSEALLRSTVIVCGLNLLLFDLVMLNFNVNTTRGGYIPERKYVKNYIVDNPISYNFADDFNGKRTDYIDTYMNLALLKNRPGVSSFHSMYNASALDFRRCIDAAIFCPTLMMSWHRESLAALMSVRHVYDFKCDHYIRSHYSCGLSKPSGTDGERRDFCYFIPIGFAYDSYVPESDVTSLIADADSINIPLIMLNNIVVADSDTAVFSNYLARGHIDFASASDTTVSRLAANLKEVSEKRRRLTVEGFRGTTRGFTANSDFPDTTVVFFSVADDPGFTAYLTDSIGNRVATPIYRANLGMSAIIVPKGKHTICFDYFPPGLKLGAILSLLGVALLVMLFVLPSRRVVRNEASCQH